MDVADENKILKPFIREKFSIPPPFIEYEPDMTPEYFFSKLPQYLNRISAFLSKSVIEGVVVKNYDE